MEDLLGQGRIVANVRVGKGKDRKAVYGIAEATLDDPQAPPPVDVAPDGLEPGDACGTVQVGM